MTRISTRDAAIMATVGAAFGLACGAIVGKVVFEASGSGMVTATAMGALIGLKFVASEFPAQRSPLLEKINAVLDVAAVGTVIFAGGLLVYMCRNKRELAQ